MESHTGHMGLGKPCFILLHFARRSPLSGQTLLLRAIEDRQARKARKRKLNDDVTTAAGDAAVAAHQVERVESESEAKDATEI